MSSVNKSSCIAWDVAIKSEPVISVHVQKIIDDFKANLEKWDFRDSEPYVMNVQEAARRVGNSLIVLGFTRSSFGVSVQPLQPKFRITPDESRVLGKVLGEAYLEKMKPVWEKLERDRLAAEAVANEDIKKIAELL